MKVSTLPVSLRILFYVLPLSCCLASCLQLAYFQFLEEQAAPKFDALNQAAFDELPPPPGIIELERTIYGTKHDSSHGRLLWVDYSMGQMTEEQVSSYYTHLLLSKGWQVFHSEGITDTNQYIRGTACLDLNIYPHMTDGPQYNILIWQDFWNQSFGPSKPSPVLLPILDFDASGAFQCSSSSNYH